MYKILLADSMIKPKENVRRWTMEYKALIWGSGEAFVKASASIFREVDKGHLKIIGVVGNDLEYRKFYGYTYYPKSEVKNLEFDLVIVCSSDNSLPSIYKEGSSLGIPRDKFLRGSVFSLINFDLIKYMLLRENPVSLISICCCVRFPWLNWGSADPIATIGT